MAKPALPILYRLPENRQQPGRRVVLAPRRGILDRAGYLSFHLGTCHGALRAGPTAYELLAVVNEQPGNGAFQHLLKHLLALARAHRRDLVVAEVKSDRLAAYLQREYRMQLVKGTSHLLLAVAGPGTCPPELLRSTSTPPADYLLAAVTRQVAGV